MTTMTTTTATAAAVPTGPTAPKPTAAVPPLALAALVALALLAIVLAAVAGRRRARGEGFAASPGARARRAAAESRAVFDGSGGAASYTDYKLAVAGADPVLYADTRRLWRANGLDAEAVARTLA